MKTISLKSALFWTLIFLILFMILFSGVLSWKNRCAEKQVINASITVKDIGERKIIGLNTNTDSLKFGTLSPGLLGRRSLMLTRNSSALVQIYVTGDLKDWITVVPLSPFFLNAGTSQEINFEVNVPDTAPPGDYLGKVILCIKE